MAYAASVGPEQFASSPDSMQAVVSSARRSTLASSSMSSLAHLTTTGVQHPPLHKCVCKYWMSVVTQNSSHTD